MGYYLWNKILGSMVFAFVFFILLVPSANARVTLLYDPSPPSSQKVSDANCGSYIGFVCNNGPSVGDSGGCGTTCTGGASWEQHTYSGCYSDPIDPENFYAWTPRTDNVCSTGDKYNSSNTPVMNWGSCSCEAGNGYKTCCNGTTPVGANSYAVDPYPPPEADCGAATTVYCGQPGQPLCGQDACNTLATPTPTPTR